MKISIITINYNNKSGLIKTIQSIVAQEYRNFQFIVIDGGSKDGSLDVIHSYEKNIDYWVSEPDRGIYHAMNKGITQTSGDYCIFMNSGDVFHDEKVLLSVSPRLDGTDILYGNTLYTDGMIRKSASEYPYFSFFYINSFAHQSTLIKTALLKKYLYDENLKIVADWKFFLQTLILGNASYKAIDRFIAIYDVTGISSNNKDLYEKERSMVLNELFPKHVLADYQGLIYGRDWEEKLYREIRHSSFHKLLYKLNLIILRSMTFFRKGSTWVKKYPFHI